MSCAIVPSYDDVVLVLEDGSWEHRRVIGSAGNRFRVVSNSGRVSGALTASDYGTRWVWEYIPGMESSKK